MRAKKIYNGRSYAALEFVPQLFNEANFSISLLNPPNKYNPFPGSSPIYWGSNLAAFIAILVVYRGVMYSMYDLGNKGNVPLAGFQYKIQIPNWLSETTATNAVLQSIIV